MGLSFASWALTFLRNRYFKDPRGHWVFSIATVEMSNDTPLMPQLPDFLGALVVDLQVSL